MDSEPGRDTIEICAANPDDPEAARLVAELDAELQQFYDSANIFGLHSGEERDPMLHFFLLWLNGKAVGCGALRILDQEFGEVKRMYVRPTYRRRGLSRLMLRHLEDVAAKHDIKAVRLETGPEQREAIALYRSGGYRQIPVYGEYVGSPVSYCMEKGLDPVKDSQ